MPDFRQRLILFKPMRPGVSGYARLQSERGALLAQLNARGLEAESVQAYWYGAGGEARLMGATRVNAHGEASLTAELPGDALAPERLQAVLLLSGGAEPVPLMIGLCVQQSAGSLLDAKNAALALCERLARMQQARSVPKGPVQPVSGPVAEPPPPAPPPPVRPAPQPQVIPVKQPRKRERELPREIFLPAIDPLPYVDAARRAMGEELPERSGRQAEEPEGGDGRNGCLRLPAGNRHRGKRARKAGGCPCASGALSASFCALSCAAGGGGPCRHACLRDRGGRSGGTGFSVCARPQGAAGGPSPSASMAAWV